MNVQVRNEEVKKKKTTVAPLTRGTGRARIVPDWSAREILLLHMPAFTLVLIVVELLAHHMAIQAA